MKPREALNIAKAIQQDIDEVLQRGTPKPLDTYPERRIESTSDCPSCGNRYLLVHVDPAEAGCNQQTPCMRCGHPFPWHRFAVYCSRCEPEA